ncbi:MAG: M23 family metallopeptidase [Bacteroidetes bacterium]|nr:M23 family metallopeptidase [Bacteroidota bacterium]
MAQKNNRALVKLRVFIRKYIINNPLIKTMKFMVITAMIFVGYYFIFAVNLDAPIDSEIKASIKQMQEEYNKLNDYNNDIEKVLYNLEQRDSSVYYTIFNTYPNNDKKDEGYIDNKNINDMSKLDLINSLARKSHIINNNIKKTKEEYHKLENKMIAKGFYLSYYPSIQPIANNDLDIKIASAGRMIDPFYRGIIKHNGIDYLIPEETRVFASASGTVKSVTSLSNKQGIRVKINHLNGYETTYSHLKKSIVHRGEKVVVGEIVGYSGNTGVSFIPHLHFEVKYNGKYLDPTNFFFRELLPKDVEKLKELSKKNILALD